MEGCTDQSNIFAFTFIFRTCVSYLTLPYFIEYLLTSLIVSVATVNPSGSACPYALKMIACQLLLEITTFLRETYQYIPRTKVSGASPAHTQNQGELYTPRTKVIGESPVHTQNQGELYTPRTKVIGESPVHTQNQGELYTPRTKVIGESPVHTQNQGELYTPRTKVIGESPVHTQNQGKWCPGQDLNKNEPSTNTKVKFFLMYIKGKRLIPRTRVTDFFLDDIC